MYYYDRYDNLLVREEALTDTNFSIDINQPDTRLVKVHSSLLSEDFSTSYKARFHILDETDNKRIYSQVLSTEGNNASYLISLENGKKYRIEGRLGGSSGNLVVLSLYFEKIR